MALVDVKVPQLSESVAEATLLQWKKKPGEAVAMDEILIEIETDKVVLEVPAPAAGVMAQLIKNDGETCVAEEVIARIDTEGQRIARTSLAARSDLSRLEDLDMTEAIARMQRLITVLEAAQGSFVKASNLSLWDLLR